MIMRAVWQLSAAFVVLAANLSSSVHAQCVQSEIPPRCSGWRTLYSPEPYGQQCQRAPMVSIS